MWRRSAARGASRCFSLTSPRAARRGEVRLSDGATFEKVSAGFLGGCLEPQGGRDGADCGADELGAVYRFRARMRRLRSVGGCRGRISRSSTGSQTRVPTPPHFAPLRVVGWGRRAAKVDGRGAWAARAALGMLRGSRAVEPRYPFGGARASAPATRRHAAMWSGAAAFWLWRPCWRAGRERRARCQTRRRRQGRSTLRLRRRPSARRSAPADGRA